MIFLDYSNFVLWLNLFFLVLCFIFWFYYLRKYGYYKYIWFIVVRRFWREVRVGRMVLGFFGSLLLGDRWDVGVLEKSVGF